MITLDTSGIMALLNRRDPDYERTRATLQTERPPFLIPMGILAETAYMIEAALGYQGLRALLTDLASGKYQLWCGDDDVARATELVQRYHDLPLGLADAMVIACAERHGGRVLKLDRRHFGVVGREGTITVVP